LFCIVLMTIASHKVNIAQQEQLNLGLDYSD
jgi:hypothetical protein